ncbi:hypothetical protein OHB24_21105 [Kribbella sp. NBC_00482]|uniref:hypothetical protein n=1 Tax=Kribbella sp. NBC_00482 TaxID=2975968 RepID=UPI002E16BBB7
METAAQALMALLEENPSASRGGVAVAEDRKSVVVYWKGDPPASVKSFAAGQPVPVVFRGAAYSQAELMAAAWSLLEENKGVVTSAGPSSDYSGVAIGLSSKVPAPEAAVAALKAHAAVPIEFIGIEDIKPLASRNADRYPWYGGGLMHLYGTHIACGSGAGVYAGPNIYLTTAEHCGAGTWYGYNSGEVGVASASQRNVLHDIRVIRTSSGARIWTGDAYTEESRQVLGTPVNPAPLVAVTVSGSASGNTYQAPYVALINRYWYDTDGIRRGPGFRIEEDTEGNTGGVQEGDSGSPVVRSDRSGNFQVNGFLSGGLEGYEVVGCQLGRHIGFNGPCYQAYYAVNAVEALSSMGLHLQTNF